MTSTEKSGPLAPLTGEGNQYELADEFGVHQTHIGRIVRGTRRARG